MADRTLADRTLQNRTAKPGAQPGREKALRLGLRMIKGLSQETSVRLLSLRQELHSSGQTFTSFGALNRQLQLPKKDVEALAEAGAFEPLQRERRQVLWAAREPQQLGLFQGVPSQEPAVQLPDLQEIEVLALDYERVRLSLTDHPLRHLRGRLRRRGVITTAELAQRSTGDRVAVGGLVLARQRPGTASGVVFVTLEDETGVANLVFYSRVFDEYRQAAQHSSLLLVRGKVERQDPKPESVNLSDPRQKHGVASIIHLLVESAERLSLPERRRLSHTSRDFR